MPESLGHLVYKMELWTRQNRGGCYILCTLTTAHGSSHKMPKVMSELQLQDANYAYDCLDGRCEPSYLSPTAIALTALSPRYHLPSLGTPGAASEPLSGKALRSGDQVVSTYHIFNFKGVLILSIKDLVEVLHDGASRTGTVVDCRYPWATIYQRRGTRPLREMLSSHCENPLSLKVTAVQKSGPRLLGTSRCRYGVVHIRVCMPRQPCPGFQ
jgi:hypothetical protein